MTEVSESIGADSEVHQPGQDDSTALDVSTLQNTSALQAIVKAEFDQMILVAKQYPRSITKYVDKARTMLNQNVETAIECFYVLPRAGKKIEGPSVRLAEIVAASYGNLRVGGRVVDESDEFVTGQGVVHDLENNLYAAFEVKRRIVDSRGRRYNIDMIGTTGNAAASIGFRNALFRVVPKILWLPLYREARTLAKGDIKTLDKRRTDAMAHFEKLGVSKEQVFEFLGVQGIADIDLDKLVELVGIANSIRDGETTVEQFFLPKDQLKTPQRKAEPKPAEQQPAAAAAATEAKPAEATQTAEAKPANGNGKPGNGKPPETKSDDPDAPATKDEIKKFLSDSMTKLGYAQVDIKTFIATNYAGLAWPLENVKRSMLQTIYSDMAQARKK